jgi:hypothetical protein
VSEVVRDAWIRLGFTGAVFSRVELERVGRRAANAPIRPRGAEPEDRLRHIPATHDLDGLTPYFAVTVISTSGLPPGVETGSICPECERALVPVNDPARRLVFDSTMWRGADITILATTLFMVVTDRVRETLEEMGATNIIFTPAAEEPPRRTTWALPL